MSEAPHRLNAQALMRLLLLCVCICSPPVLADSNFQVSGFGTLGLSYEHQSHLGFFRNNTENKDPDRNLSLLPDSQLGLQLSYRFNDKWHVTTQFVAADKVDYDLNSATEWAFVSYRPTPDITVRAGRLGVDMFQLSDLRRVDYVIPWVRPPTEMYSWIIPFSINGADIAKSFVTGNIYWRIKAQYGSTYPRLETPDGSQTFKTDFNHYGVATLTAELNPWSARLSYARFTTSDSQLGFASALQGIGRMPGPVGAEAKTLGALIAQSPGQHVNYLEAALNYDDGHWAINSEWARITTSSVFMPTGNAGYLSVGHRFGPFMPYLMYARFTPDKSTFTSTASWSAFPGGDALKQAAVSTINGPMINQYTNTLGVRWDIAPKLALKAQWDQTHIRRHSYGLWASDQGKSETDTTVNLFSLALDFIF